MGSINFQGGKSFQQSENTCAEFNRDAEYEEVKCVLEKLSNSASFYPKVCYVYGMGAHPKSTYQELQKQSGLKVIFYRSVLPKKWRFLSFIIASYEGLIKIEDPLKLREIFLTLMENSMVGVFFMDPSLEGQFINCINKKTENKFIDCGVKADRGYSFYIVDADNLESKTGIVEIISYGHDALPEHIPVVT